MGLVLGGSAPVSAVVTIMYVIATTDAMPQGGPLMSGAAVIQERIPYPSASATLNPTDKGSSVTLSGGNLSASMTSTNTMVRATLGVSSGKWYWEVKATGATSTAPIIGIAKAGATLNNYLGEDANGFSYYGNVGTKINNAVQTSYGSANAVNDIIGVALDLDNGTLTFYKNGVSMGQAFSGLSGTFYPALSGDSSAAVCTATANFGAKAFSFSPPSGYSAIASPNITTGGVVLGGSAISQDNIPFTPTGGGVLSGVAPAPGVYAAPASGGGVLGGSAPRSVVYASPVVGGLIASSNAIISDRQSLYVPSGGAVLGGAAVAYMFPAGFTPTAENPHGDAFPGWAINYDTSAPSRILGMPANSFMKLGGVTYCTNAGGVYAIDQKSDAGQPIHAEVMLPKSDYGNEYNKRAPEIWVGAQMDAAMVMKIVTDNADARYYSVNPVDNGMRASRIEIGKGAEGRYWQIGFSNVAGADFTLESLNIPLSILKRHGR